MPGQKTPEENRLVCTVVSDRFTMRVMRPLGERTPIGSGKGRVPPRGACQGSSRFQGNLHGTVLGEGAAAMPPSYPTIMPRRPSPVSPIRLPAA
jgi:hypothetical protein